MKRILPLFNRNIQRIIRNPGWNHVVQGCPGPLE
jgi:hypothetical protein